MTSLTLIDPLPQDILLLLPLHSHPFPNLSHLTLTNFEGWCPTYAPALHSALSRLPGLVSIQLGNLDPGSHTPLNPFRALHSPTLQKLTIENLSHLPPFSPWWRGLKELRLVHSFEHSETFLLRQLSALVLLLQTIDSEGHSVLTLSLLQVDKFDSQPPASSPPSHAPSLPTTTSSPSPSSQHKSTPNSLLEGYSSTETRSQKIYSTLVEICSRLLITLEVHSLGSGVYESFAPLSPSSCSSDDAGLSGGMSEWEDLTKKGVDISDQGFRSSSSSEEEEGEGERSEEKTRWERYRINNSTSLIWEQTLFPS